MDSPTHEEMVQLQATGHALIDPERYETRETFVQHLIHTYAYECARRVAADRSVLDVGCNTGYGSAILASTARTVTGVDVSGDAVALAERKYAGPNLGFRTVDGKRLPFDDGSFDLVTSFQVIEHVVDYDLYLGEIRRVLKPDGVALFATPNANLRLDPGMKPWYEFHVAEFRHQELATLLARFFEDVIVLGLFAKEPTYSVEHNRVTAARDRARKESNRPRILRMLLWLRRSIRRSLPQTIQSVLLSALKRSPELSPDEKASFAGQHSIDDFHYSADNLPAALDLLGVCSNTPGGAARMGDRLKMQ